MVIWKESILTKGSHQLLKQEEGMKQVLLVTLMVFMLQSVVFAEESDGIGESAGEIYSMDEVRHKGQKFTLIKARALQNIARQRSLLSELESCVASSYARADLKSCRLRYRREVRMLHQGRNNMREKHEKRKDRERH